MVFQKKSRRFFRVSFFFFSKIGINRYAKSILRFLVHLLNYFCLWLGASTWFFSFKLFMSLPYNLFFVFVLRQRGNNSCRLKVSGFFPLLFLPCLFRKMKDLSLISIFSELSKNNFFFFLIFMHTIFGW